jgi:hypothetical protein
MIPHLFAPTAQPAISKIGRDEKACLEVYLNLEAWRHQVPLGRVARV